MNSINAIFVKQSKDMFRNIGVLAMFVVFPLVALAMTHLVQVPGMPDVQFVSMMAAMFIGMGLIMSVATILAEDRESNSLRFLVIAGVSPMAYIIGIGGVVFLASIITSGAFGLIGGIQILSSDFINLMVVMLSGAIAAILLGAIIGLMSKNVQAATGLTMPLGMMLGLGPMAADFNDTVARVFDVLFTQQVSIVIANASASIARPLAIIWINIAVLAIAFAIVYKKKLGTV